MNKFIVRFYTATGWSFLTQADHFEDLVVETNESMPEFAP
jgi:hypothetical protein